MRRGTLKKRHFLLLAPFLPPYDNGGVHRPLAWLRYAEANGWAASVITRPFTGSVSELGAYLQARMPRTVNVRTMPGVVLKPSWKWFPRTDGSLLGALGAIDAGEELIERSGISLVIATGPSFDFFVSAFYLSRMYRLPLLLDYRDEWTDNPFRFVQCGNSDRFWERRCLKAASLVTYSTESMLIQAERSFAGLLKGKAGVLHNGWEPDDIAAAPSGLARAWEERRRLKIAFAGTMGDATLPGAFLNDLEELMTRSREWQEILRIELIGTRAPRASAEISRFRYCSALVVKGSYPKDVANGMIRDADMLLLLSPSGMERYIPAKLFEYLASGRPILVHGAAGEASRIVSALGAGFFVPAGKVAALEAALKEVHQASAQKWNTAARHAWAQEHKRDALAKRFFTTLCSLTA